MPTVQQIRLQYWFPLLSPQAQERALTVFLSCRALPHLLAGLGVSPIGEVAPLFEYRTADTGVTMSSAMH